MATESEYVQRDAQGRVKVTLAAGTSVQARVFEAEQNPVEIATPPLQHRRFLLLRNFFTENPGSTTILIGGADLDVNNGYPLVSDDIGAPYKSESIFLEVSDAVAVYGMVEDASAVENFRTLELA
jgi:hypothetical protein